jgi:hypothetical protein
MRTSFLIISAWLMGAVAAQANVYICSFKPGPRDYWMSKAVMITDPGSGPLPTVWDDMIEKEVGRPLAVERISRKFRTTYSWSLVGVDLAVLGGGSNYTTGTILYNLSVGPDHSATFSAAIPLLHKVNGDQLFGTCTVQP